MSLCVNKINFCCYECFVNIDIKWVRIKIVMNFSNGNQYGGCMGCFKKGFLQFCFCFGYDI